MRIIFIFFSNYIELPIEIETAYYIVMQDSIFQNFRSTQKYAPNGYIISTSFSDTASTFVTQNILLNLYFNNTNNYPNAACAYWNTKTNDWAFDGCSLKQMSNGINQCVCTHTTFFGLVGVSLTLII